jgi:hypothetical protein
VVSFIILSNLISVAAILLLIFVLCFVATEDATANVGPEMLTNVYNNLTHQFPRLEKKFNTETIYFSSVRHKKRKFTLISNKNA